MYVKRLHKTIESVSALCQIVQPWSDTIGWVMHMKRKELLLPLLLGVLLPWLLFLLAERMAPDTAAPYGQETQGSDSWFVESVERPL